MPFIPSTVVSMICYGFGNVNVNFLLKKHKVASCFFWSMEDNPSGDDAQLLFLCSHSGSVSYLGLVFFPRPYVRKRSLEGHWKDRLVTVPAEVPHSA